MKQYKPGDVIPKEELKRYTWGPIKKGDLVAAIMGYGGSYRHGEVVRVGRVVGVMDGIEDFYTEGEDDTAIWSNLVGDFVKVSGVRRRSAKPKAKPKPKVKKKVGRKPVQIEKDASGLYALCDDNSIWWLPSDSAVNMYNRLDAKWYQITPVPTN